ncbi:MAG: hypothetical protein JO256_13020 [Alphaproteobacteria bacterium]|nr:hypothetical protein [Alphaproteobacteria bacterium]
MLSQAVHTIDLMRCLCGPVVRVTGFSRQAAGHTIETEDIAAAALRFEMAQSVRLTLQPARIREAWSGLRSSARWAPPRWPARG